jgi:signal recognition particle receptor subunit beta
MGWTDKDSWATWLFSPSGSVILIALIICLALPILDHIYNYTSSGRKVLSPTFLLLGPSGSGKTSLLSLLQRRSSDPEEEDAAITRTSQAPSTIQLRLPPSIPLGSNKYRSENDSSLQNAEKNIVRYDLTDTPGHGKLRQEQALSHIENPAVKGILFVVDSSALDSSSSATAQDAASFLHDLLLLLQKKSTKDATKNKSVTPVLIAANKQDLFTALPQGAVKDRLQAELERVRSSRSKGLTTVGQEDDERDQDDVLGGGGEDKFSFKMLEEEYRIRVDVLGGAVRGDEAGKGVRKWEEWIGSLL